MAHFAELDNLSKVIRTVVLDDKDTQDSDGNEDESIGVKYLQDAFGGTWIQTSYNTEKGAHKLGGTPFRKNYAGKGYTYDEDRDAFIEPQPHPSWILDETTCIWGAPIPKPDDDKLYNLRDSNDNERNTKTKTKTKTIIE